MTFELSPEQLAHRDQARALAERLRAQAAGIDRSGHIPDDLQQALEALRPSDDVGLAAGLEELAVGSAGAAVAALSAASSATLDLAGLRGARQLVSDTTSQLGLAAIALGIGRAAIELAIAELRHASAKPTDVEKPHGPVADAATELDAARLLTYQAAATGGEADTALARLMASAAAEHAVAAALRIAGVAGLASGSPLERLTRDVRAIGVIGGGEDQQRATAAEGLLPQH